MAQYRTDKQEYVYNGATLHETNLPVHTDGRTVTSTNPFNQPVVRVDDGTVQHTSRNRRKVSTFEQIFFNTFQYDKDLMVWDEEITGTASATFDPFEGGVILEVGGAAGDEVVRQTRNVVQYIPGRQNEALFAVRFNQPVSGVRRRIGLFDESNGFYFEDGGDGTYYVALRRNTSSGLVETRIPREDWNVDKLDGTGPSGIDADPSKIQMLSMEYEWFGAGIVEIKWIYDNNAYPIHQFSAANLVELPWSNTPFLPARLELTNTTGAAGTHQMFQGSTAVSTEGTRGPLGREENAALPIGGRVLTDKEVFYPVLNIRLRSDRLNGVAIPTELQAATLDNTAIYYKVLRNTTLTGANWQDVSPRSFCEYDYEATTFTGGEALQTGFLPAGNNRAVVFPDEALLQLGRNNLGTEGQTFTIAIACVSASKNAFASLSWVEIR
jgi:hypothetical protein